jgi:hypothetical protein
VLKRNPNIGLEGFHIDQETFFRIEEVNEEFDSDEPCIVVDNSKNNEFPSIELRQIKGCSKS